MPREPVRVRLPTLRCRRCGKHWRPRKTLVRMCPHCKSLLWNEPKRNEQGQRRDLKQAPKKVR